MTGKDFRDNVARDLFYGEVLGSGEYHRGNEMESLRSRGYNMEPGGH